MEATRREWTWIVPAWLGWAGVLLLVVTVQWTPDCGGVSYGLPLPFLETFIGSSMEFLVYGAPLLLDLLVYLALLSVPVWLLVRHLPRRSARGRRLFASLAVLPAVGLLWLGLSTALGWRYGGLLPHDLYVHTWRTESLHLGPAAWGQHLEDACN